MLAAEQKELDRALEGRGSPSASHLDGAPPLAKSIGAAEDGEQAVLGGGTRIGTIRRVQHALVCRLALVDYGKLIVGSESDGEWNRPKEHGSRFAVDRRAEQRSVAAKKRCEWSFGLGQNLVGAAECGKRAPQGNGGGEFAKRYGELGGLHI